MGIKDYYMWMRKNHPSSFKNYWLDAYDHIYIDLNYALHLNSFGAKSEGEIVAKLICFLDRVISKFTPMTSIVIANDGPPPLAKLLLQRERRAGSARTIPGVSHSETISNLETSSLIFTPGTKFMNSIKSKLKNYMDKIIKLYKIKVDYMVGCDGEAELKLKQRMSENIELYPDDTHIIISNDADIIAMFGTLNINSFFKVFICSNSGAYENAKTEIISMGVLMDLHTEKYGMTKNFGVDFTILSTMLGNDYLPKIDYIDLDKLMQSYRNAIIGNSEGLIKQNLELNIKVFTKILNGILVRTQKKYTKNFMMDNLNQNLYSNYMDGLLWCLDMYNKGVCTRYNYMYENDDNPHPFGLILHVNWDPNICKLNQDKYPSIDSDLYSLLVMPKKALSLINPTYHIFAEQCEILYEKELCVTCNKYYNKLKITEKGTDEYKQLKKDIKLHDGSHSRIIVNDIMDIVKRVAFGEFATRTKSPSAS
jgi:5'-3' exonuclease